MKGTFTEADSLMVPFTDLHSVKVPFTDFPHHPTAADAPTGTEHPAPALHPDPKPAHGLNGLSRHLSRLDKPFRPS